MSECAQRQSGLRGFGAQVCLEESLVSEQGLVVVRYVKAYQDTEFSL